ncbi:unnamed protein product [Alternaria alternata]
MTPIVLPADLELGRVRDGYPALARWIAQDPDDDPLLFRKFGRVAARNILHLQCQMTRIEGEIDDLDEQVRTATSLDTRRSLQRWEVLWKRATTEPNSLEKQLTDKLKESQELLKDYYEALALRAQVAQLGKPSDRILTTYKDFLSGKAIANAGDDSMNLIYGRASKFLDEASDLVALQKPTNHDYLSRSLRNHWLFTRSQSDDSIDRATVYKDTHVARVVAAISMVLAAILLVGAISSLYFVINPKAKLGLLALYTILFAMSVGLCTNARRAEVFATTAAYAAVLVGPLELITSCPDEC